MVVVVLVAALFNSSALWHENPPSAALGTRDDRGIRHWGYQPAPRHTLAAFALMPIVLGLTEAWPCAVPDSFGKPPTFAVVVVTDQGAGAIVGVATASSWVWRPGEGQTVTIGKALLSLSRAIVALTSTRGHQRRCGGCRQRPAANPPRLFGDAPEAHCPRIAGSGLDAVETVMGVPPAVWLRVGALLVTLLDYHVILSSCQRSWARQP
jgi:hypothetical protein